MRFFYSLSMLLFLFLAILHFAGCGGVEVDGEQMDGGAPCTLWVVERTVLLSYPTCPPSQPYVTTAYDIYGRCTAYVVCGP